MVLMPRFDPHEFLQLVTDIGSRFWRPCRRSCNACCLVYRAGQDSRPVFDPAVLHLAAPCPPVIKQAWIDILGPEAVWELYGGTELQALTFIWAISG